MDQIEKLNTLIFQHIALGKSLATLEEEKEQLRTEINILMKENNLTRYLDTDNNSVTLTPIKRETLDKTALSQYLGEDKLKEFTRISESEMLKVTSAENKEKQKKFMESKFGPKVN